MWRSLLIEGLYDGMAMIFDNYAQASLKRRIQSFLRTEKLASIAELQAQVCAIAPVPIACCWANSQHHSHVSGP
jgi:hypothetical protein